MSTVQGLASLSIVYVLVNEEASRTRGDVVVLVLQRDSVQVHEIAVQFAEAGRRVPARRCQHLQAILERWLWRYDIGSNGLRCDLP